LINAAAGFVADDPAQEMVEFLTAASLEAGEHQAEAGSDALQLMTVHAAKGLEFDAVFVSGLEEGLFPHENSLNDSKGLQEERRLMYVAVTRARKRLYLSSAQSRMLHGQSRYPIRSRFVDEIPAELVHELAGKKAPARAPAKAPWLNASMPAWAAPQGGDYGGFHIGQSVSHAKFGPGMVVSAEGSGSDVRLQINFAEHGMKWLDLRYAKLVAG
ncbi:3'-5' exonuclease, partial [Craterilacuibacter sp.]|uniref:3'-5' exonuclease n=1 Tax=Craterilacuibacter sp. TaxID=2870909 RepID=UPI003F3A2C4E